MYMKLLLILIFSNSVFAATLECNTRINLDAVANSTVITSLKTKNLIGRQLEVISYVTETANDFFSIEVYLPALDSRIYSEGAMRVSGETLSVTAWTREILAEVTCKKIN